MFSGIGVYYWVNGSVYKGEFKNGLRDGNGVYQSELREKYEGSYREGKKHGYGVFIWPSGNVYKGDFVNDLREGYGEMSWKDGSYYKGQWMRGIQNGKGEFLVPRKYDVKGVFHKNVYGKQQNSPGVKIPNRSQVKSLKAASMNFHDSNTRHKKILSKNNELEEVIKAIQKNPDTGTVKL